MHMTNPGEEQTCGTDDEHARQSLLPGLVAAEAEDDAVVVGAMGMRAGAVHERGGPTAAAVAAAVQLFDTAAAVDLPNECDLRAVMGMIMSKYDARDASQTIITVYILCLK